MKKKCYWCEKIKKENHISTRKIMLRTYKGKKPIVIDVEQLCNSCFKKHYKKIPKQFLPTIHPTEVKKLDLYSVEKKTLNFFSPDNYEFAIELLQRIARSTAFSRYRPMLKSLYAMDRDDLEQSILLQMLNYYKRSRNSLLSSENILDRIYKKEEIEFDYERFFFFIAQFHCNDLLGKLDRKLRLTGIPQGDESPTESRMRIEREIVLAKQKQKNSTF